MHTFFTIIRSLFGVIFLILILALTPVWMVGSTISRTVVQPQNLKMWVAGTGVYDSALDITINLLTQLASIKDGEDEGDSNSSLINLITQAQDPSTEYGQFARKIFARDRLQQSIETVIDAFYAWLRGETERPEFEVRLLDSREDMVRLLTLAFKEKFNALPVCPASSLVSVMANFNPFDATCRPAFMTDVIVEEFITQLANQPELATLLDSTTIKGSSLKIDSEFTKKFQLGYLALQWLSAALGGLIILFTVLFLVVFPWKKAAVLLGGLLIAIGGAGSVGWFVGRSQTPLLLELAMQRIPPMYKDVAVDIVQSLIQQVVGTLSRTLFMHTLLTAAFGVLLITGWCVVHFTHTRRTTK